MEAGFARRRGRHGTSLSWHVGTEELLLTPFCARQSDDDEDQTREGDEASALAKVQPGDAAGLAAVFAEGSDDELEPPKAIQAAAKTKAEAAGKLIDEERAREVAQLDGGVEALIERQERTVWRSAQPRIRSLETLSATMEGEGWLGRMASLLKGDFSPKTPTTPIRVADLLVTRKQREFVIPMRCLRRSRSSPPSAVRTTDPFKTGVP